MESYDHEESMASTIVHHHMEPSLAGDGAPPKAKSESTLAGSRETKSRRPPVQDLYDRMKAYLKAYDHTKLSIPV